MSDAPRDEIETEPPPPDKAPTVPSANTLPGDGGRVRPGVQGLGGRALLLLLLAGLLPTLVVPLTLLPLAQRAEESIPKTLEGVAAMDRTSDELRSALDRQRHRAEESAAELQRLRTEMAVRGALADLASRLGPLTAGEKTADELATDKALAAALQSASDPFSEVALLDGSRKRVLLRRGGLPLGSVSEVLPDLAAALGAGGSSPPPAEPGWHWARVADGAFLVAAHTAPLPGPAAAEAPPAAAGSPSVEPLQNLRDSLSAEAWALSLVLPLLAALLALALFLWLRSRLLAPAISCSATARRLLEEPEAPDAIDAGPTGLLDDLAASLSRLRQRLRHGREAQAELDRQASWNRQVVGLCNQVADGHLEGRLDMAADARQEVGQAFNRMLDVLAERLEGLRRSAAHLQSAARQVSETAVDLDEHLSESPALPSGTASLGAVFGVQLDSLFNAALNLEQDVRSALPKTHASPETSGDAGRDGAAPIELLRLRVGDVLALRERLQAVRQDAEVLATNLSIGAEAESRARLDDLVEEARALAHGLVELGESQARALDLLRQAADGLIEGQRADLARLEDSRKMIESWAEVRRLFLHHADLLHQQIGSLRPSAATLGADVQRLTTAAEDGSRLLRSHRDSMGGLARSAESLSATAEAIGQWVERFETGRLAPAEITRSLARQHQSLERSIQQLRQAAAAEGIESLSADAAAILERIHTAVDAARERIMAAAPADSRPKIESDPR